jgi:DNA polymerase III epsilon subunit-like protein
MRYLSAVLLSGMLIFLPSCKYFKGGGLFGRKARALAIEKALIDSVRVLDSLQKVKDKLTEIENARLDSLKRADEERLAFESKHKYNIIVGSFITPEYAKMMNEAYRKQGYDPSIIKMENSRFELVSVEGHDSFRNAVARLSQFRDTVQLESWLYVKK